MALSENLSDLKSALRGELCVDCQGRAVDDSAVAPAQARCERNCTLFANLGRLIRVVSNGEPPCGFGVFAKALQSQAPSHGPDMVYALTILEAVSEPLRKANKEVL